MKCIEDEIPFELPEGWEWTRLDILTTLVTDYVANGSFATLKANVRTYKEKNYALFVRTVDFANNFEKDLSYIDKESYDFLDKSRLYGGELMLSNIGASIGKVFKIPYFDFPMSLAPNSIILKFHYNTTSDFFEYVFRSFVGQDYLQRLTAGTAMPKFNKTELKQMLVPLPTLTEQERIIAKIKELLSIVDFIESDKTDLQTTIQLTKSKILDLAIRGKLVPQNPDDEPASVLLERIRAEKEELIKQGKIKRDKKESVIFRGEDNSYYEKIGDTITCIDEELPFELPDGWAWIRLQTCCQKEIKRGKSPKYAESSDTLVFAQKCNTKYDGINMELALYLDESTLVKYPNDEYMQDKDTVINSTGTGTLGRVGIYRKTDNRRGKSVVPDSHVTVIRANNEISAEYLYFFLKAYQQELEKLGEGSTNQKELKPLTLKNLIVALPPYAEQERIIEIITAAVEIMTNIEKSLS